MKEIVFSQHALDQLIDRGASQEEVQLAIQEGEESPAKKAVEHLEKIFTLALNGKINIMK